MLQLRLSNYNGIKSDSEGIALFVITFASPFDNNEILVVDISR